MEHMKKTDQQPDVIETRYTDIISGLNRGKVATHIDEQLRELNIAIRETGKPGKITVELSIEPKTAKQVQIVPKITAKVPKANPGLGLYFLNEHGGLQQDDPDQMTFDDIDEK